MLTKIDTEKVMHQTIYSYLSENVWNTPLLECRRNIVPMSFNNGRAAVNKVDLGCQSVDLPSNPLYTDEQKASSEYINTPIDVRTRKKSFYVYAAAKCCMGGLVVDTTTPSIKQKLSKYYNSGWLPLDVYLNNRPFDLRFHGINGAWLYRNEIWITNHPYQDMFLIAVEVNMARTILGNDYDFRTIYMSVYYDSDSDLNHLLSTSKSIQCFYPRYSIENLTAAYNAYVDLSPREKDQTMYFINGREATPIQLEDLAFGQYVEVVKDPDIICNILLDLTKVGENNIYRSTIDNTYKYIIHIPKEVNPNNYIITHNTCDLFVRPKNTEIPAHERLKGLFIHRFNTSKKMDNHQLIDSMITQITHNDFGVSEKLIMSRLENGNLNSSECVLRVVVRRHSKTKILRDDANFINLLYNFNTDEQILQFLTGHGDESLPFWRAEHLEQSNYAKMLVNFPFLTSYQDTKYYLEALGYFNSLCVLTPRVMRRYISEHNTRTFDVSIPLSMQSCDDIGLLIYLNDNKISNDLYSYVRDYQYLRVTLNESVRIQSNDKITFELFDANPFRGEYFIPSQNNNKFWVQEGVDFDLYQVVEESATPDYYTSNYLQNSDLDSFVKIEGDELENFIEGSPIVEIQNIVKPDTNGNTTSSSKQLGYVISSVHYGKKFFICNRHAFARFTEADIESADGNTKVGKVTYHDGTCTDLIHSGILKIRAVEFDKFVPTTDTKFVSGKEYYTHNESSTGLIRTHTYTLESVVAGSTIPSTVTYYNKPTNSVSVPIINKDWNSVVFVNNRELVRDIDYTFCPIYSQHGIKGMVWFFNCNCSDNDDQYEKSYLKLENNKFEIYLTADRSLMRFDGFMHNRYVYYETQSGITKVFKEGVVEDTNPYIYWFDRLCNACVDGVCRPDMQQSDGYLKILANRPGRDVTNACRQGGLYYTRGFVPIETKEYIDRFLSIETDIVKLAAIAEYRKKNAPPIAPEIEVIPHSHHITSITMNAVVKDVLTGVKSLAYESDPSMMLRQLSEYESMKKYDAAMTGVAKELILDGAGYAPINNTYKLIDPSATGNRRRWVSQTYNVVVYCNYNQTTGTYRWEIATFNMLGQTVYYYATDPTGMNDPWELEWNLELDGEGNPIDINQKIPKIDSGNIDLRYLDLFPSYSSDLHFVVKDVVLKQAMRALFPVDDVTDGDTVS